MGTGLRQGEQVATGIDGLDRILGGGLTAHRVYLIEGVPGSGKSTIAMQFLMEGAQLGETCLYITLSETEEELRAVADSHGWSLDGIHIHEIKPGGDQLDPDSQYTMFHPSEVELNRTTQVLMDEIERVKPVRVVFDSLSEMRMLAETPLRYRRQILFDANRLDHIAQEANDLAIVLRAGAMPARGFHAMSVPPTRKAAIHTLLM